MNILGYSQLSIFPCGSTYMSVATEIKTKTKLCVSFALYIGYNHFNALTIAGTSIIFAFWGHLRIACVFFFF